MSAALAIPFALSLAQACAPQVAPLTLLSVARTESGLDPMTIGVNGKPHRALHPPTREAAVRAAKALQATGANFDLGLTQVNSRNLMRLGLSIKSAFDPCRNLAAGGRVLTESYLSAQRARGTEQAALKAALSTYNTGDPARGLQNGYVAKVYRTATLIVPSIGAAPAVRPDEPVALHADPAPESPRPPLDVFARAASSTLVWADPSSFSPPPARVRRPHHPRPGDLS